MKRRKFLRLLLGLGVMGTGKVPILPKPPIPRFSDQELQKVAEDTTVGSVMMDPEMAPRVLSIISSFDLFSSPPARLVFGAISILHRRGVKPSLHAVYNWLEGYALLGNVGGYEGLVKMVESVPNPKNAEIYAGFIASFGRTQAGRHRGR